MLDGIEREHDHIRTLNQQRLKDQERIYGENSEIYREFSATLKQVNEFTTSKADDKERFYETRIAGSLKEYSHMKPFTSQI